jgi:hypothetical protein
MQDIHLYINSLSCTINQFTIFFNFPIYKQQARLLKNLPVLLATVVRKRVRLKTCCCIIHERLHHLRRNQLLYTAKSV